MLRRREPALRTAAPFQVAALDDSTIALRRHDPQAPLLVVVRLNGAGAVELGRHGCGPDADDVGVPAGRWDLVLTTEDPAFSPDSSMPEVHPAVHGMTIRFHRPSAVVLRLAGARTS